jgi:hypothetical protein
MSMLMSFSASDDPYQTERPRVESTTGSAGGAEEAGGSGAPEVRGVVEGMLMGLVGLEENRELGSRARRMATAAPWPICADPIGSG